MTMYTQAQMDEVINKAREGIAYTNQLIADNDAATVKLLRSLGDHIIADRKDRALHLVNSMIAANS